MKHLLAMFALLPVVSCGESGAPLVGPEGAELQFEGVQLTIPPGAVTNRVDIRVEPTDVPSGFRADRAFRFTPRGLVFERPVVVRFLSPVGDRVFWSSLEDIDSFDELTSTSDDGDVLVTTTHFSVGFVGSPTTTADDGGTPFDAEMDSGDSGGDGGSDAGMDANVEGVRCEAHYGTPPECDVNFTTEVYEDVRFDYDYTRFMPPLGALSTPSEGFERLYNGHAFLLATDAEATTYEVLGVTALRRTGSLLNVDVDAQRLGLCSTGPLVGVRCSGTTLLPDVLCDGAGREIDLRDLPALECRSRRRDASCNPLPAESEMVELFSEEGPHGPDTRLRATSLLLAEVLGAEPIFFREGTCNSYRLDLREGGQDDQLLRFEGRAGVAMLVRASAATCVDGSDRVSRLVVTCSGTTTVRTE